MNAKLTDTQTAVLKAAAGRADGNIAPLPPTLRGGARARVIAGLLARELITTFQDADHVEYYLTDTGYAAIGRKRKLPAPIARDPELEAAVAAAEATWQRDAVTNLDAAGGVQNLDTTPRALRPGTKLAEIVDAMRRPGGATIAQMTASTGRQAHTVRGAISCMVRKRLGYQIVAEKGADGQYVGFWRARRPSHEMREPAPGLAPTADVKKASVPLSISCPGIKHKVAKSYRTHDHRRARNWPGNPFSPLPENPENHNLANRHEIKQFVAKKYSAKRHDFSPFSVPGGTKCPSRRSAYEVRPT